MLLIHGATIVTVDAEHHIYHDAALTVEGGRIGEIGPSDALRARYAGAPMIDARGKALLPGFANTHTHFSLTLARGIFEDMSLPNRPPFDARRDRLPLPRVSAQDNAVMCQLGALEAIRSGTTAVLEDGTRIAGYAEPLVASGLRLLLAERVWDKAGGTYGDQGGFRADAGIGQAGLDRVADLHARWHDAEAGRVRVGVAAWSPDMCSPALLRSIVDVRQRLGLVSTIHLNQLWGEVAAVKEVRGLLPTEYLAGEGFLGPDLIAAHCRCMTAREEEILGSRGVTVAFNPAIASRRGLSPRISELQAAGCSISIGTDNMAEDMVEAMRTAMFMERVRRQDGRCPTPAEALHWATAGGYRGMGIPDGGSLVPGHRADLILVDLCRAHLVPLMRPVASFVHQGQARDVESVMVDGRWLMRDGVVLTMNEAEILREADRIARNAWRAMLLEHPDLTIPEGFDLREVAGGLDSHNNLAG